jgi:cystathionine gamma-synthase
VATRDLYGGTLELFRETLVPWGVELALVAIEPDGELERECRKGAGLVYVETPTNPLCRIVDLRRARAAAELARAPLACDATFASPWNQATLACGADLSIQSATKYLGGHSDLLGGSVAGSASLLARIAQIRKRTGSVPDPEQAWRLERSLKTLALRMERQNASALAVARFLEQQPAIERVHYPGLEGHPDHALARRQMRAFGGIVTFDVAGGEPAARRFAEALRRIAIAPSLGGVETLICPPIHTSHARVPPAERRQSGITEGSLRLSVGVEDVEDLIDDLKRGLAAATA